MLLGAAKYLASTRKFKGAVALIFQPAEQVLPSGALRMIQEGVLERFSRKFLECTMVPALRLASLVSAMVQY